METIPNYFVYGEAPREIDIGFLHVETVMARRLLHNGHVLPHVHDGMAQITFWTGGAGRYLIEDRWLDFSAPAVSFVPSGVVHGFRVDPESDAIVVSLADGILPLLAAQTSLPLAKPLLHQGDAGDPDMQRLATLLGLARAEYDDASAGADKVVLSLAAAALTVVRRLVSREMAAPLPLDDGLAQELRKLVDAHFREDWSVSRYAERLGTTPYLMGKACRGTFDRSVKELLTDRRLLEAKRLLRFTIRPVEDIAYECGFRDPAYFSRFFRLRTGVPPGLWRLRAPSSAAEAVATGPG